MAVPEQTPYIEHTGNGSSKSFSLGFQCESKDHLIVLIDDIEPPIATWSLTEGNVVFTTAPTSGKKITLQRNTPFERTTDYQSYNNSFRPPAVNNDFDRVWRKLQELGLVDWILSNRIDALKNYVDVQDADLQQNIDDLRLHSDQQDSLLQQNIENLKGYVDDKDDELRNYLLSAIQEQGVALDQLEEYYSYLMQQLAQVAIDHGWAASFIVSADGSTQQQVNDRIGNTWYAKTLGYELNARVMLTNGDIVKSTIDGNANDPNVDMTGWVKTNSASQIFDENGDSLQLVNDKTMRFYQSLSDAIAAKSKLKNSEIIFISEFHAGTNKGGSRFRYEQGRLKNQHNGGTIIDLDRPFPTDWNNKTQVGEWLTPSSTGNGCLVRLAEEGSHKFSCRNFGTVQNADCTLQIQKAIDSASLESLGESAWLEAGDAFNITALDLRNSRKQLRSDCRGTIEFGLPTLTTVGQSTIATSTGRSVAILLADAATNDRGHQLVGFHLIEGGTNGATGWRYYGIYSRNCPWTHLDKLHVSGFNVSVCVASHWNSTWGTLTLRNFRKSGLAGVDRDLPLIAENYQSNGWHIESLHTTSATTTPDENVDMTGGHSVHIGTWVTEGGKLAHLRVGKGLISFRVDCIHAELKGAFILLDTTTGVTESSDVFGSVYIGSGVYMGAYSYTGYRFIQPSDNSKAVALASLEFGDLEIHKHEGTASGYFNMRNVADFSTRARFLKFEADAAIDAYTWYGVGDAVSSSKFRISQFGHNGLPDTLTNKGIYTGIPKEIKSFKYRAGSLMTTAQAIFDVELNKQDWYEVDVHYTSSIVADDSKAFWAKFYVFQSKNNTLNVKLVDSLNEYALDTAFTLDTVNLKLLAQNARGSGQFYFTITKRSNIIA